MITAIIFVENKGRNCHVGFYWRIKRQNDDTR